MRGNTVRTKLPLHLAALSLPGMLALGFGLHELIAPDPAMPMEYRFQNYEWALIAIGFLFELPAVGFHVKTMQGLLRANRSEQ